jgi:hypothetical protein
MPAKKKVATEKVSAKKKVEAKKAEPGPVPEKESEVAQKPQYSAWQLRHMKTRR